MLAKVIPRAELTPAQRAKNKQMIRIQPEMNWSRTGMRNLTRVIIAIFCLCVLLPQAHAATKTKSKAVQPEKERLVLMPLRVPEEDKNLLGAMETALVKGLHQKYEVFSGEQVAQKARQIFLKESRNTAKKECDETRCMQGIAEAFQAELIATANVTKQSGSYFLALSIQNIFDNKVVQSESLTCKNCDAVAVIDKLKELVGAPAAAAEVPQARVNLSDPETALWEEAKKGNAAEDYQAYLSTYPKGKYAPLAKTKLTRLKDEARAAQVQQDQQAWNTAQQGASPDSYAAYLNLYPQGQFVALAQGRIDKIKREAAEAAARSSQAAKPSPQKVQMAQTPIRISNNRSPGDLTKTHASFEDDCDKCHKKFDKSAQPRLCKSCHAKVKEEISNKTGIHGQSGFDEECKTCHTEHKGRDAKIIPVSSLLPKVLAPSSPIKGHTHSNKKEAASKSCGDCHEKDDTHNGDFGPQCQRCHVGEKWREIKLGN